MSKAEHKPKKEKSIDDDPVGRKCSICGVFKPWDKFENDKRRPSGHGPRCKECLSKKSKKRKKDAPLKNAVTHKNGDKKKEAKA